MTSLEEQLEEIKKKQGQILKQIEERNKRKTIRCGACEKSHRIGSLTAIQTHWYVEPYSCTEGDYWKEGELQFICPETEIVNRILFDNYDVPYEKRKLYENDPEKQFKHNYKHLFKEVVDRHDRNTSYDTINNYFVDEHRKKFGLVKKRKKDKS